jgi:hypothetical protein
MNAKDLIEPMSAAGSAAGLPAPVWFVQLFKVLGFTLHAVPMNLWYAGLLIALLLQLSRNRHARQFSGRLVRQMPVIVAVGINFGIVPLLFVQLAYYRVFYPATILMAWFWLGIVVLLVPAYYGVYAYALGMRGESKRRGASAGLSGNPGAPGATAGLPSSASATGGQAARGAGGGDTGTASSGGGGADIPVCRRTARWRVAAGWCAAALFIVIAFLFANGWSLMEHVGRWPELWQRHNTAGAALGTALNVGDPTLWPRWLLMFGLALGTTAVWLVFDAEWFARKTAGDDYRRWAWGFARWLYTASAVWFAAAGSWYVFGTWPKELRAEMFSGLLIPLTLATAAAPGLPWLLLMAAGPGGLLGRPKPGSTGLPAARATAALVAVCQFGLLGINAVSRQVAQNVDLREYLDVVREREAVQWGPLVMFLVVFVIGLAVVAWMIAQVVKCRPAGGPEETAA